MPALAEIVLPVVLWFVAGLAVLFDFIFGWLPEDFFIEYIEGFRTIAAANLQAFQWLNWFVDMPFAVAVFGFAVAAMAAATAFKVMMYLGSVVKDAVQTLEIVKI